MTVKSIVIDGTGTKQPIKVDNTNALFVQPMPHPPFITQKTFPFTQFFTDTGKTTGSNDMRVVGSLVNPVDFFISADNEDDRYITTMSFVIADLNASLNQFGNIGQLVNGVDLSYEKTDRIINIKVGMLTNFDFIQLACGQPAFGDAITAFRANNVIGNTEAYIPCVDLTRFGLPFGIKIDAGTKQRLVLKIQDDITGVDAFTCVASGFQRIP